MDWNAIVAVAVTLFLVMDPVGNMPVFNALLAKVEPQRRMRVIARELLIALGILLGFLLAGNAVLAFLGLTEPSLNIAGGVLLFIISLRMIFPLRAEVADTVEAEPFIVPLAVPLVAGPSTIAVLLLLSSRQPDRMLDWTVALLLAWIGGTLLLLGSSRIAALLGERGAQALERLMGMILVILATQMLLNGVRDFIHSL